MLDAIERMHMPFSQLYSPCWLLFLFLLLLLLLLLLPLLVLLLLLLLLFLLLLLLLPARKEGTGGQSDAGRQVERALMLNPSA